ncbi:hypothetical protein KUH03_39650 [Sphingobacterium sp. E70]|uniref:hypothetical protein n=1 Tax=Sphingobacterium sp. E70 TaxID=2853439 RepID=UPI00211BB210|nr:hypothetical protein [Sphingobacterium sp. E70]ULT24930.1 hypothetical protein KUH03_39650 [Sphingobacterium sp. E70]
MENLSTQVTLAQQSSDFFDFNFTPSYNTGAINGNSGRNSAGRNYKKVTSMYLNGQETINKASEDIILTY